MTGDAWAVLGILGPLFLVQSGTLAASIINGRGWKTSYEREKERADRQDAIARDAALATDIAVKTAQALHKLSTGAGAA